MIRAALAFVVFLITTELASAQSSGTCEALDSIIMTRNDRSTGDCTNASCSMITCNRPFTRDTNHTWTYTLDYCSPNVTLTVVRVIVTMQDSTVDINRTTTGNDTISSTNDGTPVTPPIKLTLVQDGDSIIFGVFSSTFLFMETRIPVPLSECETPTPPTTSSSSGETTTPNTASPTIAENGGLSPGIIAAIVVPVLFVVVVVVVFAVIGVIACTCCNNAYIQELN